MAVRRRSIVFGLLPAFVFALNLLLAGPALAISVVTVKTTASAGSVTHYFDRSPAVSCTYQYDERVTVHYSKVTATSIAITYVDVFIYPKNGDAVLGGWLHINNDTTTYFDKWDTPPAAVHFYTAISVKTFTVNKTVPFLGGVIQVGRMAGAYESPSESTDGCISIDTYAIGHA